MRIKTAAIGISSDPFISRRRKTRGGKLKPSAGSKRGLSLAELIIGLALFAIVIIPIFGIIPTAYMSIRKAEDYSAASCYAQELVELYRLSNPSISDLNVHNEWDVILNTTEYRVAVDVYGVCCNIYGVSEPPYRAVDVVVNMYWKKIPEHLSVTTRIFFNE